MSNATCTAQLEITKVCQAYYDKHPPEINHFALSGHGRFYVTRQFKASPPEDVFVEELEILKMARVFRK
jgi:hypothetical protein